MLIGVLGVNHKSAELSLRESLAKVCVRRFSPGRSAHSNHFFVLLSTCNRTEIYFSSDDLAVTHSYLLRVLRYDIEGEFEHKLYSYFGFDCFVHLAKVTAGMDSAIIAETEVQGQVKSAYESVKQYNNLPRELHFLFQKSLKIGKDVRTGFPMGKGLASLEEAILQVTKNHMQDIKESKILFLGASEINIKVCRALLSKGIKNITFCNRTLEHLDRLAFQIPIKTIAWQEKRCWINYDVVIVGTKSVEYLLLKNERLSSKKQLLIDLSVPRNIDPELDAFDSITLLNVDQMNKIVEQNNSSKLSEISVIDRYITESVENQIAFFLDKENLRSARFYQNPLVLLGV
ncbi:MAG: hypothetical protein P4L16_06275 [Chlamydiales bacterium]|nr:hypothetical protein [Chlamydiales bacterium]